MTDIDKYTDDNQGGHKLLQFTPVENIVSFPDQFDGEMTIPIQVTDPWLSLYYIHDFDEITETPFDGDTGHFYKTSINRKIAGDSKELRANLREMRGYKFIVLAKDKSGDDRVYGTPNEPLHFEFMYNSGSKSGGLKGYELKFYGDQSEPAPFYNPT